MDVSVYKYTGHTRESKDYARKAVKKIREGLEIKKITQTKLAADTEISYVYVNQFLNLRIMFTKEGINRLLNYLNITI